jgi:hypothetical protein
MKTCPDCGERVYELGCVNCNEVAYIQAQGGYEAEGDLLEFDCGRDRNGYCGKAGSEECDWECPYGRSIKN